MKVVAYMPVRNEAGRILDTCLRELTKVVDAVAVYDDQSTDNTVAIAQSHGCRVTVRPDSVPAWIEHEGRMRQAAWDWAAQVCELDAGDWIFAVDADEFVGHPSGHVKEELYAACANAHPNAMSILVQKHEVFGFDTDGTPLVRVDGYWGQIIGTRLARWMPGGRIADKAMGCGCEPTYVNQAPKERRNNGVYLLHYGYVTDEERKLKHHRYSTLVDHGHNDRHIQSIVQPPALRRWEHGYPSE